MYQKNAPEFDHNLRRASSGNFFFGCPSGEVAFFHFLLSIASYSLTLTSAVLFSNQASSVIGKLILFDGAVLYLRADFRRHDSPFFHEMSTEAQKKYNTETLAVESNWSVLNASCVDRS